jgi:hypothetical protein
VRINYSSGRTGYQIGFRPGTTESTVLIFGREILVIGTTALTPSLGDEALS